MMSIVHTDPPRKRSGRRPSAGASLSAILTLFAAHVYAQEAQTAPAPKAPTAVGGEAGAPAKPAGSTPAPAAPSGEAPAPEVGQAPGPKLPLEVPPGSTNSVTTDESGNVVSELLQPPALDASSDRVIREEAPLVGDSFGAGPSRLQFGILNFRFLLQTRFQRTWPADSQNPSASYRVAENTLARDGDGWSIQRFFVRIGLDPYKYLELKTIVDLAEFMHDNADNAIKQAYVTFKPIPKHLELTVGAFKLPFSILELDPSADYPFADFGPADSFVKDLGFAGRDIGAELLVAPLKKPKHLQLGLGIFRGHAKDEHSSPVGAIGARIESEPVKGLRFGVDWVGQPSTKVYLQPLETSKKHLNPSPSDPQYPYEETWAKGNAFSADARYQRHHLLVEVEGMIGKRVDVATRYGASTFAAIWGLIAYRFRVGPVQMMPTLRAEFLDADREHPVGLRRVLSAGFNVYATKAVRFIVDLARTDVQANSPLLDQPKPVQAIPYNELDETRIIGQLQILL